MAALDERLDKAEEMIAKPSFRENKGLGNEVGYYGNTAQLTPHCHKKSDIL